MVIIVFGFKPCVRSDYLSFIAILLYICTPIRSLEGTKLFPFFIQCYFMVEDRIAEVLNERFEEDDLSTCFLVSVQRLPHSKLVVFIDSDEQLTIDMCRKTSRFLEHHIEENGWMPEKYTIDVSSPGIDNPLKLHRQYVKNIGRTASVQLKSEEMVEGKLEAVEASSITLQVKNKESKTILFEDIKETKILVSFK